MSTDLAPDDAQAIAETVRRFIERAVAPLVERPEDRLAGAKLAGLTEQACELGLLNLGAEEGLGLWDNPHLPGARAHSVSSLRELAKVNAGIAFHFHQLALGATLSRMLGACDGRPTGYDLLGTYGMGRSILPRFLRGAALTDGQRGWLAAYFEPTADSPRLVQVGTPTEALWLARFDADAGALSFERFDTTDVVVERLRTAHGLDETDVAIVDKLPARRQSLRSETDPSGAQTHGRMLELESLGLCAISVGTQHHSWLRAAEYAELRVQGGTEIVNHPAVQTLVGRTRAACVAGDAQLDALVTHALEDGSLDRALGVRAALIREGCRAANDALQVFGGSGYMRDNGMEKLVRDQNHLRVFRGSPAEQLRFVAELGRAA